MLGGFEYWVREGLPVETDDGVRAGPVDALTRADRLRLLSGLLGSYNSRDALSDSSGP